MQIVRNLALIGRRKRIGQIASLVGIGILIGGMALTWLGPRWNLSPTILLVVPVIALLVGFIASSIGIYYTNNYARSPRSDQILDQCLKGLSKDYKLYHYLLPAPHVLLTPIGVFVIVTRMEGGTFSVEGDKWRQRFSAGMLVRFMGREGLGNPSKEAQHLVDVLRRFLTKNEPDLADVLISPIVVFTADKVMLHVEDSAFPILRAPKVKGYLRSRSDKPLPKATYRRLESIFDRDLVGNDASTG